MEGRSLGVAGGRRSGETSPGRGSSRAPSLPPTPAQPTPASAPAGYGRLGEALRSTRAGGAGRRFSGPSSGNRQLSRWLIPTPTGAGSGDPPQAANPQRRPRTKMMMTGSQRPRSPPTTALWPTPTPGRNHGSRLRPQTTSLPIPTPPGPAGLCLCTPIHRRPHPERAGAWTSERPKRSTNTALKRGGLVRAIPAVP